MIALEGIVSLVAYVTATIASLQAGTRARYLLEHNEIGVKDGPLILPTPPDSNETSPLWDLVHVFQQSVQLGLLHHHYDRRFDQGEYILTIQPATDHIGKSNQDDDRQFREPYSLSCFPNSSPSSSPASDDEIFEQLLETDIEDENCWRIFRQETASRSWQKLKSLGHKFWPPALISTLKQATNYWMQRSYYWRKSMEEFEEEFIEEADDGMSLVCTSGRSHATYSVLKSSWYALIFTNGFKIWICLFVSPRKFGFQAPMDILPSKSVKLWPTRLKPFQS